MPDFETLRTVLLSLLPGLFWVVYLRSLSRGRTSPWWHWVVALTAGWLSTELTLFLSDYFGVQRLQYVPHLGSLLYFVFGVGLVEEASKALCAVLCLKFPGFCKQPLLGLQLCGGVALGFATAENILYAQSFGDSVLVGRFVFSTLGHVLFASVWGFALGSQTVLSGDSYEQKTSWWKFFMFLLLSALGHGLFDWFLISGRPILAIITLVVLWFGFREAVLGAFLRQEYQRQQPLKLVRCSECAVLTREDGRYCSFCGSLRAEPSVSDSIFEDGPSGLSQNDLTPDLVDPTTSDSPVFG